MYDLAHGFWNLAKNVIDLVSASGKMHLKPVRKADEQARGRFIELPSRPPWVATPASLAMVSAQLLEFKVPVDWPANPPFGEGLGGMKIAEVLAMCGERDQWIIGQLDIDAEYCAVLVGVLGAAAAFLKKVMSDEALSSAHAGLVDALAMAEATLPMQWSTITSHMLLHAADWVTHIACVCVYKFVQFAHSFVYLSGFIMCFTKLILCFT